MEFLTRIRRLFSDWFAQPFKAVAVEDFPDAPEPRIVYLVGDAGDPWSAGLICPCGCREHIKISLIRNDRPRWRYRTHNDSTVSLDPSIWRVTGCCSHFTMVRGRIRWARARRNQTPPRRPR